MFPLYPKSVCASQEREGDAPIASSFAQGSKKIHAAFIRNHLLHFANHSDVKLKRFDVSRRQKLAGIDFFYICGTQFHSINNCLPTAIQIALPFFLVDRSTLALIQHFLFQIKKA